MFGRSQSGPSGLSINTNTANSLSTTSTSQPPPAGGLFGSQQKEKSTSSIFGSTLNSSQPQQGTNLFSNSASQPSQTTSIFTSTSQPQPGNALFGNANQQSQPSTTTSFTATTSNQSSGLFGTTGMNSQQPAAGGQSQQNAGIFGTNDAQQSQPQQASNIFSSLGQNTNQNQPNTQTSSLFSGGGSIFSNNMHQSQQPNQHNPQIASIGHFTQQQQPVPGVRVTTAELRPTTRFNDLHEQLQTLIENVDSFIQQQMKYQQECASFNLHLEANSGQIPYDVEICTRSLETMQQALENDAEAISYAKDLTKIDIANARLSIDVIQSMRMPPQFQQSNIWALPANSQDMTLSLLAEGSEETEINANLVSYFSKQVDNMSKSLNSYKKDIAEVESYLKGVEADTINQIQQVLMTRTHNGHNRGADDQVRELAAVLKDFENGILGVASKVGGVREQVQEVMLGD